jgi:hypothetical protein
MAEEIQSQTKGEFFKAARYLLLLIIIVQIGIVLFGDLFDADKTVLEDTSEAQERLGQSLYQVFNDNAKLEVRQDYSVHAYISIKNYMSIPYPDRDAAITKVGKAWCDEKGMNIWYLSKVQIRDIESGDALGTYRCFFNFVSKK